MIIKVIGEALGAVWEKLREASMEESVEQLRELHVGKWVGGLVRGAHRRGVSANFPAERRLLCLAFQVTFCHSTGEVTAFEELCCIKGNM